MYQFLGAIAAMILAFLAGAAKQNAKAAIAFNQLRNRYDESLREIDAMSSSDVDDELADRLRGE